MAKPGSEGSAALTPATADGRHQPRAQLLDGLNEGAAASAGHHRSGTSRPSRTPAPCAPGEESERELLLVSVGGTPLGSPADGSGQRLDTIEGFGSDVRQNGSSGARLFRPSRAGPGRPAPQTQLVSATFTHRRRCADPAQEPPVTNRRTERSWRATREGAGVDQPPPPRRLSSSPNQPPVIPDSSEVSSSMRISRSRSASGSVGGLAMSCTCRRRRR